METLDFMYLMAKNKIRNFLTEERGEVNIVATVVLIGIAVALAIIFRDEIEKLLVKLLKLIGANAEKAVRDTSVSASPAPSAGSLD